MSKIYHKFTMGYKKPQSIGLPSRMSHWKFFFFFLLSRHVVPHVDLLTIYDTEKKHCLFQYTASKNYF